MEELEWENNFNNDPEKQIKECKLHISDTRKIIVEMECEYAILRDKLSKIVEELTDKRRIIENDMGRNYQSTKFLESSIKHEEARIASFDTLHKAQHYVQSGLSHRERIKFLSERIKENNEH